jgi:hypothetical protein
MIGSFSFVANDRAKREAALLIKSIRQFYDCPIFALCDDETKAYLESLNFEGVKCKVGLSKEELQKSVEKVAHVQRHNDFHSAPIILKKMDCIEWALSQSGDTFFVDADIVFIKPVHDDIDQEMELILSPHFHCEDQVKQNLQYGSINAGYLWTRSPDLPEAWREIYLTRSKFFEQQGMIHFLERFDVGLFGKAHNLGFWRFLKVWNDGKVTLRSLGVDWSKAKALHFHAFPETYAHADEGLTAGYDRLKEQMWPHLTEELRTFAKELSE